MSDFSGHDKDRARAGAGKTRAKAVLKRHMIGLEIEVFTIDSQGNMINAADNLIKKAKGKYPDITVVQEAGENMLEIRSFPHINVPPAAINIIEGLEGVLSIAEKEGIGLLTLGTHPGNFVPMMRRTGGYGIKEQVLGEKRFRIAGRCCGLHCHYTLPWGMFDRINLIPKMLSDSKHQRSMVNSYNLLIAMDPALTTFMQSSPFYQGNFIGKDSRVIVYRGGEVFNYPKGLYANFPEFGGLQSYKHTGTDLMHLVTGKYERWKKKIKSLDVKLKVFSKHGSILDTTWNPVKVNANGTLEQRGMDMNHPTNMTAAAVLIKFVLGRVQEDFMQVVPSDIGIKEPFKTEGNVIYIPPHTHVRMKLQPESAFRGFDSDDVLKYCRGLLKFGKSCMPKDRLPLIKTFEDMLDSRETVSDEIMKEARKKGFDLKTPLPNRVAAEIALDHSRRLFKEIVILKKTLHDLKIM